MKQIYFQQALNESKEIAKILSEKQINELLFGKQQIDMAALMVKQILKSI